MPSWNDVLAAAPDLAQTVQARFEEHGLGLLATIRAAGSPRITGIEPAFVLGELWLGMMPGSRKAADVARDPRFALHASSVDKELTKPDARISGRLAPASPEQRERLHEHQRAAGQWVPADVYGDYPLYVADIREIVTVGVAGDRMRIRSWTPGRGERTVERS
jgi:hypothetical protein